jgi:hypothetical protein
MDGAPPAFVVGSLENNSNGKNKSEIQGSFDSALRASAQDDGV